MQWRRSVGRLLLTMAAVAALIARPPVAGAAGSPPTAEAIATPPPAGLGLPVADPDALGPLELQCAAVRSSSVGNVLDARRATVCVPRGGACRPRQSREARAACTKRQVLALAAEEARNRDAGQALLAYWSLSEAEHSLPELETALIAINAAIADWETLAGRGLDLPVEDAPLRARRLALEDARVEVAAAADSLRLAVCQLGGLPPGTVRPVHPAARSAAVEPPGDVDALLAEGLTRRPELRMLRTMLANLDDDTAEVGTLTLALANPALGAAGPEPGRERRLAMGFRHADGCEGGATAVRWQLQRLLAGREAAIATEIRQAARRAAAAAERVALAERQRAVAEQTAADARARQPVGDKDAFAVHLADIEAAAARRGVIERLAGYERAEVELRQAQGVLAAGCGCH